MAFRPSGPLRIGRIGDWNSSGNDGGNSSGGGRRIATLGDMGGGSSLGGGVPPSRHSNDDDDDDEEDDDPQEGESWFAGGERSGISVQNPDSARRPGGGAVPGGDAVREVLRRAAQSGPPPEAEQHRGGAFSGGGHTLGSDEVESTYVADPHAPPPGQETAIRNITFWQDGFTIEDGELLRYDDPENSQILAELNAGRAPPAILNVQPNQPVELRISKRINENYVPPKRAAFSGSGNRLGAPVPGEGSSSELPPSTSSSAAASSSNSASQPASIQTRFEVDTSKPTTSVQVRLADGTRMVARMNHDHTVLDLRNFINASRPENLTRPYTIGTTFPNRTLEDDAATIKDAGLINSVVVQRWA
ncbi:hypothetical protein DL96DRAFT_1752964 [Flagelloscypha sp. PMI_526]|nr:hypothetical protein DL96DRAFT_1752964 [Flagelloscypha sp. PMI_526]